MSVNIQTENNTLQRIASVNGTNDSMIIDSELSETSEHPVQNKVIAKELSVVKKSVSDGKTTVANAITEKGINTATDATFQEMADNIELIETGVDTSDATASESDILSSKTAYVNGQKITGTMPDLEANSTLTHSSTNGTKVILGDEAFLSVNSDGVERAEIRYYDDVKGRIRKNTLFAVESSKMRNVVTQDTTAEAKYIVKDKTAYVKGAKVTGTLPDRSSVSRGASGVVGLDASTYPNVAVSPFDGAVHWRTNADGVKRFCLQVPYGVYGGAGNPGGLSGDGYVGYPVQHFGDAAAENVLSGKKFTSANGLYVSGTMTNRGAVSASIAINGSYNIPAGYHNGSGKVTQSITTKSAATYTPSTSDQTIASGQYLSGAQTIKGDANLIAENIKDSMSIFGVKGTCGIPMSSRICQTHLFYNADTNSSNSCSGHYITDWEPSGIQLLAVSWSCKVAGMVVNGGLSQIHQDVSYGLNDSGCYILRIVDFDANSFVEYPSIYKSFVGYMLYNNGITVTLHNGVCIIVKINSSYNTIQIYNQTVNSNLRCCVGAIIYQ